MEFFDFTNRAQSVLIFFSDNVLNILLTAMLIGGVCFALVYAFQATALYTIAKRDGYAKKWMAFVPFLNTYYIGVLSEKNKIFNFKAKTISLVTAIVEGVYAALSIIFYVAMFTLAVKGYLGISYTTSSLGGQAVSVANGFLISNSIPANLVWAEWIAANFQTAFLSWLELVYLAFNIMLLILFFQTYASRHYLLFTVCSVLFPVKGLLLFVVRNNKGLNYRDFIREQQARQYAMYQQYNRQNMNNPYNYNPYSGRTQPPPQNGNPYEQPKSSGVPSDPFEEFSSNGNSSGSSSNGSSGNSNSSDNSGNSSDPFGDL
jgi:hypothetical protein